MSRRPAAPASSPLASSSALPRVPAAEVASRGAAADEPWLVALVRPALPGAGGPDPDDAATTASAHLLAALRELAGGWQSRVGFGWADVDEAPAAMDDLRVFHVPELLLYADGRLLERGEGEMTPTHLAAWLEHALARR